MTLTRLHPVRLALALSLLLAPIPQPAAAQSGRPTGLILPAPDSALQAGLNQLLRDPLYRGLVAQGRISVALVDVTDRAHMRYAGHDADRMRYAASLPKIGILLGVFDQIDRGRILYTPQLRGKLELMVRNSDNRISSEMIRLVGFQNISAALEAPRHALYDPARRGGIWVGRGYGSGLGLWRRDPISNTSHGATARQAARFFVMLDRGELVSAWASQEMKSILAHPQIHHKFVLGLERSHPDAVIYRKSGSWRNWHADAALVERAGRSYVAVVLLEAPTFSTGGVLADLIVGMDALVFRTATVSGASDPLAEGDPGPG